MHTDVISVCEDLFDKVKLTKHATLVSVPSNTIAVWPVSNLSHLECPPFKCQCVAFNLLGLGRGLASVVAKAAAVKSSFACVSVESLPWTTQFGRLTLSIACLRGPKTCLEAKRAWLKRTATMAAVRGKSQPEYPLLAQLQLHTTLSERKIKVFESTYDTIPLPRFLFW